MQHREVTTETFESEDNLICARDLKKVYKNGVAAVNENTFSVKKGEVFGLLGPNGAGKSTMFNMMSMELKRTSGDIRLLGNDIDKVNIARDGNKMGMCAQTNTVWDVMSVNECIRFVCEVKGVKGEDI